MPELRKDPVIGRWVIIATERARRPSEFVQEPQQIRGGFCPLCEGNEDKTPPEIFSIRSPNTAPNTPGWSLRVVPNKFPALMAQGELNREGEGVYDKMNGVGAHEVLVESPQHEANLATLSEEALRNLLIAYRQRMIDLMRDPRLRYVMVFKNHGAAAGASLEHPHSQIIALPIIPKRVAEEIEGAKLFYKFRERCIFCDIIRQEIAQQKRIIIENKDMLAIAPFASCFPFETWILPKSHSCCYIETTDTQMSNLASLLSDALKRMNRILSNPPYNFALHTCYGSETKDAYHWHIEIVPKLTKVAGFEWGTGFYINPTPPEEAARFLRDTQPEEKGSSDQDAPNPH
jgi:UDPglucose--hexose-1-phosphate uridylyltransferase